MSKDKRSDWFGTSFLLFRAAPVAFWSIGGNTLKPNRSYLTLLKILFPRILLKKHLKSLFKELKQLLLLMVF